MQHKPTLALAALVASIALTPPAWSAAWQVVNTTSGVQTEVDLSSAVRKDGVVTGWVQHSYARKTTTQTGAYFVYRSMKEQVRLDCAGQTVTVLMRGYFDDDGNEIAAIKGTGEPRTVMPETPEQRVLARLCNPTADFKAPRARPARAAVAAHAPVDARYMDGPSTPPKEGIVRVKADIHDAKAAAAPAIVKPREKIEGKPADTVETKAGDGKADAKAADAKAVEKPNAKPAPAPQTAHDKPAAPANTHVQPKAGARNAAMPGETREMVVARVLKARVGAPVPPDRAQRARTPNLAAAGHPVAVGNIHAHEAHWDYEGENAPYRWGDMKAEFTSCKSGARQSPIDIRNPVLGEVEPIRFHYEDVPLRVTNNGHTIQVDYTPGSFILFGGSRYELVQFHFHSPSEERVNGRAFDMVAHLVHKSAQGRLAVVAVLLTVGGEQPTLQKIWSAMPGTRDRTRERADVAINAAQLLPADPTYYSYMGSLTTPPCTEGVQWLVMKTPVELSREQVAHFTALYPMNARPLQALNDRLVKVGK